MNGTTARALNARTREQATTHPYAPMITAIHRTLFNLDDTTYDAIRAQHKTAVTLVDTINNRPAQILATQPQQWADIQNLAKALYRR